jgi:lipopolysaccharide/colanic/teichoic acid biosynthesis glycosyltransferase
LRPHGIIVDVRQHACFAEATSARRPERPREAVNMCISGCETTCCKPRGGESDKPAPSSGTHFAFSRSARSGFSGRRDTFERSTMTRSAAAPSASPTDPLNAFGSTSSAPALRQAMPLDRLHDAGRSLEELPVARLVEPFAAANWASGIPMPDVAGWLVEGKQLIEAEGNRSFTYLAVKRMLDIVGALTLLALLGPLMLVTYLALMVTTRGRAIFCQERVGHCGRLFPMYKFRTMRLDALALQAQVKNEKDGPVFKNRRDPRITAIGRVLRSTSIDELPQLFNVLLGHMSLVGPRPPIAKEVAKYESWQFRRLAVKPGLTCLWQVSGRCEIGFTDWVKLDIWYVENQSLWNDVKLLVRTPLSVLSRRGAY